MPPCARTRERTDLDVLRGAPPAVRRAHLHAHARRACARILDEAEAAGGAPVREDLEGGRGERECEFLEEGGARGVVRREGGCGEGPVGAAGEGDVGGEACFQG